MPTRARPTGAIRLVVEGGQTSAVNTASKVTEEDRRWVGTSHPSKTWPTLMQAITHAISARRSLP
jgi:hypothetical protein